MKKNKKMVFELDEVQIKKYEKWKKKLPKIDYGAVGGCITFCFTPTGIGTMVKVKSDDGGEINLTDFENW